MYLSSCQNERLNVQIICQTPEPAHKSALLNFQRNPRRSVSALFRRFRKELRFSLIGDYPLLGTIINAAGSIGIRFNRTKIAYVFRQSKELCSLPKRTKGQLLDLLSNSSTAQSKSNSLPGQDSKNGSPTQKSRKGRLRHELISK